MANRCCARKALPALCRPRCGWQRWMAERSHPACAHRCRARVDARSVFPIGDPPRESPAMSSKRYSRAHRGAPPLINVGPNASLERALLAAATRLAQWNPVIHFCGLPNEEQLGYVLHSADGARGELVFRHPNRWTLNWRSAREVVRETWSVIAQDRPLTRLGDATQEIGPGPHRPAVVISPPR